jgi:putative phosphoribosyl transferase
MPVAPASWTSDLGTDADEYIAVVTPVSLWSIGRFYRDFSQTTDAEVIACLHNASAGFPDTV